MSARCDLTGKKALALPARSAILMRKTQAIRFLAHLPVTVTQAVPMPRHRATEAADFRANASIPSIIAAGSMLSWPRRRGRDLSPNGAWINAASCKKLAHSPRSDRFRLRVFDEMAWLSPGHLCFSAHVTDAQSELQHYRALDHRKLSS